MQAVGSTQGGRPAKPGRPSKGRPSMNSLGRALRYLGKYPRLTIGATVALIIATAAQDRKSVV